MNVRTLRMCSYPWGFIGGRELQSSGHKGLGNSSESSFGIFRYIRLSSVMRGSPGGSSHENLELVLAKSLTRKEERSESQSKGAKKKILIPPSCDVCP